ncbi:MAG: adenylosuccinate lyase [Anaerolineae bacterium]
MRHIWSERRKRQLWRQVWVALAEAQVEAGLVTPAQAAELRAHMDDVDIARALEIEAEIRHDLMAELKTFAAQCATAGGVIHLGATSADIEDNADALRLRAALDLIVASLEALLEALADQIARWADTPAIAFTHLQPAEPTTVGYRLAQYGQDLLTDLEELRRARAGVRGKGLKGAVGTGASYAELLAGTGVTVDALEARVMAALDLPAFPVATQTYPRKQDWLVLNALAGLAGSLYKLAFDLRVLQSLPFGEWAEPFGRAQVGSSAMPFKRNPIGAENIDSLGRMVAALPRVAWDNAAHALLERTLDDKANRRALLPQAFLAVDEMLSVAERLVRGLQVNERAIADNLARYGAFAATERLLMALGRAGADRQHMHEVIRRQSMAAWAALENGHASPLRDTLTRDPEINRYLDAVAVSALLDVENYLGHAPQRARAFAQTIRAALPVRAAQQGV